MYAWIAVAVGGALGSVTRYGVSRIVQQEWPLLRFPLATAMVNIAGCFVIGVLAGLVATGRLPLRTNWREFVFVGILGGFTTFSAFGLETMTLVRSGDTSQALLNILLQVALGLAAVQVGFIIVERASM